MANSGGRLAPVTLIQQIASSSPLELLGILFNRSQLLGSDMRSKLSDILGPVTEVEFLDIINKLEMNNRIQRTVDDLAIYTYIRNVIKRQL